MGKRQNVCFATEYVDAQGETRKSWKKVGTAFYSEKGISIKLDSVPVGGEWSGWLTLFDEREQDNRQNGVSNNNNQGYNGGQYQNGGGGYSQGYPSPPPKQGGIQPNNSFDNSSPPSRFDQPDDMPF